MDINIEDGCIKVTDYDTETDKSYPIENITAEYGVDREAVLGVYRMTGLEIESTAESYINEEAKNIIWDKLCDREYNDADDSGRYRKEAKRDIAEFTGVKSDQIVIE